MPPSSSLPFSLSVPSNFRILLFVNMDALQVVYGGIQDVLNVVGSGPAAEVIQPLLNEARFVHLLC
jgi:hypothetical protein